MQVPHLGSVLVIPGLLALPVPSGGALGRGFHNAWLRSGSGAATPHSDRCRFTARRRCPVG